MITEKSNDIILSIEEKTIIANIKNTYPNLVLVPDEYIYEYMYQFHQTKYSIDKCRQNIAEKLIYEEEAAHIKELKENEERLREELNKKEAEKRLREEQEKREAEKRYREELEKREAEKRYREELEKREAEKRYREELEKREAEKRYREELEKREAEKRYREELEKREAEKRYREELEKKETEKRYREELEKREAEKRYREELEKKEAEKRLREELEKKEAEKRLREEIKIKQAAHFEELKKKEAEENFRKQEKTNQITEEQKIAQLKFSKTPTENISNKVYDLKKNYEESNQDNVEKYNPNIGSEDSFYEKLIEKKISEAKKESNPTLKSTHIEDFSKQQKNIKPAQVVTFATDEKIPGSSNEDYMKIIKPSLGSISKSSNALKPNSLTDELSEGKINWFSPNEFYNQKSQQQIIKNNPEKPIEEEIKKHNPEKFSNKLQTPPPLGLLANPNSSRIIQHSYNSIEKQLEESKRKQNEKFLSMKNKYPPSIHELKKNKGPNLFSSPKESIPSLYFQENLSYEQLMELDIQNYDKGNGYPPNVIQMLEKVVYTKECENKERCSICMEDFEKGHIISFLNCGHNFHNICLADWLSRKKKCPTGCNSDLDSFFGQN
ncbi:hypothetical protein SteCoe_2212 [Stentor coeruleus]|uniref:RING-type domain-containing protein n=1 Tax=Stentor coeruleus TaxID=5963 RepID=A0A1R2CZX9_9CILI|nr:hypothetical protein SteCoe_2212 [Stentor coeruleus]